VYIFLNASGSGTAFLKQAKAAGFDKAGIKIFCSGDLLTEQVLPAIGDAAIGVISTMNYSGAHDSKMNRDFVKAFEAQSGGLPPTFCSTSCMLPATGAGAGAGAGAGVAGGAVSADAEAGTAMRKRRRALSRLRGRVLVMP